MLLNPTPDVRAAGIDTARPAQCTPIALAAWIVIALAFMVPFLLYFDTAKSMVAIWDSSETFAHGYIILPITIWLIWRRREVFAELPPQPCWPALLLLVLVGFGWLLARMGEVQVVMQYAFVAMIPVIALAILGRRLSSSLAFPLLFLLMAVPFGEIFINPLISFTADFTVWALQTTGIPVLRNGTRFEIPSGSWSVVEACSGVRYLISSVTLGWLYAYLTYRSNKRRAVFMLFAILVPILANGMRAYMIVMIGHLSSMTLAVGVDHIIYGWLFFGLVMFVLFWVGSYWRQDQDTPAAATGTPVSVAVSAVAPTRTAPIIAMAVAIAVTAVIWPLYAHYSDRVTLNDAPVKLERIAIDSPAAFAFTSWAPRFVAADARFDGVFKAAADAKPDAKPVGLTILYYRNPRNGKAVISSSNQLTGEKDEAHQLRSTDRSEALGDRTLGLRETIVQTPTGKLLVWQWYWVGGRFIANNYIGKLLQAKDKLLLHGDDGAAMLLSAPYDANPEQARLSLHTFLNTNLLAIEAALIAARGA